MSSKLISKIITVWGTLLLGFGLCWIFGNVWVALGVFLISLSNKAEEL